MVSVGNYFRGPGSLLVWFGMAAAPYKSVLPRWHLLHEGLWLSCQYRLPMLISGRQLVIAAKEGT